MKLRLKLVDYAPLLMHSDRLANPLDPATRALKAITSKRKKTDEDQQDIARMEWRASLYWKEGIGPYIPGQNVQKCLIEGGRLSKLGRQVERGVFVETQEASLEYDGPKDADELWGTGTFADMRSVKVGMSRTMQTRPMFDTPWSCEVEAELDPSQISLDDFRRVAEEAGRLVGIGDFRPRCGRFTVTVETE